MSGAYFCVESETRGGQSQHTISATLSCQISSHLTEHWTCSFSMAAQDLIGYGRNTGSLCLQSSWRDDNSFCIWAQITVYCSNNPSISELDHSNSETSHMEIPRYCFRPLWHMLPWLRFRSVMQIVFVPEKSVRTLRQAGDGHFYCSLIRSE
jgi:hypothetical protein